MKFERIHYFLNNDLSFRSTKNLCGHCIFAAYSFIVIIALPITQNSLRNSNKNKGENFVKNLVQGKSYLEKPQYLMFTAPYKICEGECSDPEDNFEMAFPIYVGERGKKEYKSLYPRDFNEIHSTKLNAPFKIKSTMNPYTLCPTTTEEATTEDTTTVETTTEEPTTEEPTTEEPTTVEPTTEEPTTDEPTTEELTTAEPTTEELTTEEPTTEDLTTIEPTTEEPTTEELTTENPTTEELTTVEPTTEEPTTEKPTTEELTTEEPTIEESTTEEPTTEEPTTEELTTVEPTTDEPTTEEPTTEEPTIEEPTTEITIQEIIAENPAVKETLAETTTALITFAPELHTTSKTQQRPIIVINIFVNTPPPMKKEISKATYYIVQPFTIVFPQSIVIYTTKSIIKLKTTTPKIDASSTSEEDSEHYSGEYWDAFTKSTVKTSMTNPNVENKINIFIIEKNPEDFTQKIPSPKIPTTSNMPNSKETTKRRKINDTTLIPKTDKQTEIHSYLIYESRDKITKTLQKKFTEQLHSAQVKRTTSAYKTRETKYEYPDTYETDYNSYGSLENPPTTSKGAYVTNTNAVKCPKVIFGKCRSKRTKVTDKINYDDYEIYNNDV